MFLPSHLDQVYEKLCNSEHLFFGYESRTVVYNTTHKIEMSEKTMHFVSSPLYTYGALGGFGLQYVLSEMLSLFFIEVKCSLWTLKRDKLIF